MPDDEDEQGLPQTLMDLLGLSGKGFKLMGSTIISPEHEAYVREQGRNLEELAAKLRMHWDTITDIQRVLKDTVEPASRADAIETTDYDGFMPLSFFHALAGMTREFMDNPLSGLESILEEHSANPDAFERRDKRMTSLMEMQERMRLYTHMSQESINVLLRGVISLKQASKVMYSSAMDHFRYLQKRFLNIEPNRQGKITFSESGDEESILNLRGVEYVKTRLVEDNPLVTELALNIMRTLPNMHTRERKVKGKLKRKLKKELNDFEVDRTARLLVELANPDYQAYTREPARLLHTVADAFRRYYVIMNDIHDPLVRIFETQSRLSMNRIKLKDVDLHDRTFNPEGVMRRLATIDYLAVKPHEEDVEPSNARERKYFALRHRILEELVGAIAEIPKGDDEEAQFEIAREAVARCVKWKEDIRKQQETHRDTRLKKDKQHDKEFYVGTSSDHGEFAFAREPAPHVKMSDVHGKSFDAMKEHLADLKEYSKYILTYTATAPRGKIKTNMLAIGPFGCGKTEIGRAIAADSSVIAAEVSVTQALTMWFGEFEKNIDRIWDGARQLRRESGDKKLVFLLMDEFDTWFNQSEGNWVDGTYQRVQKAIQMKLDGLVENEGIVTVAFTNEPNKIPLPIMRRFKYVDVVGELTQDERATLLRQFLTKGLPISGQVTPQHYRDWSVLMDGATGDVIGKVADDIHYGFMRQIVREHPDVVHGIERGLRRTEEDSWRRGKIRRELGKYIQVTPQMIDIALRAKLSEPAIVDQIEAAQNTYKEARERIDMLHARSTESNQGYFIPPSRTRIREDKR